MRNLNIASTVICVVCLSSLAAGNARAAGAYILTDLGMVPYGINNSGQVVGCVNVGESEIQPVLYSGGTLRYLPGALGSWAASINNSGQIAGSVVTSSGYTHAVLWSGGAVQDLGTFGGPSSSASGINDSGQIVGWADGTDSVLPFLYSGGTMQPLGTLAAPPIRDGDASAINDGGQVAGSAKVGSGALHAVLYTAGTAQDLGTLPAPYDVNSSASAINDSGQVVGTANDAAGDEHAFLYSAGTMRDLGTLGGADTIACGINDGAQVVGEALTSNRNFHAFLYSGGTMQDLNNVPCSAPGWTFASADAINDSGQIAGSGDNPAGRQDGFLLTPALPGDANLDGRVDINDLTIVLSDFGKSGVTWTQGEFTGGGTVDINDLTIVLANFGFGVTAGAGVMAVPEPSSLALLAVIAIALLAWRSRARGGG